MTLTFRTFLNLTNNWNTVAWHLTAPLLYVYRAHERQHVQRRIPTTLFCQTFSNSTNDKQEEITRKIAFALLDLSNMGIWITPDMIWHVSAWSFWRFSLVREQHLSTPETRALHQSSRQISKLCLRERPSQALADGAIWTWSWPSRLIFGEEIHRKTAIRVSETQRPVAGAASRQTSENQKCKLQFFKASLAKSRTQNPNWKLDYCSISKEKDPQVSICFTWLVTFSFEFSFVADGSSQVKSVKSVISRTCN